MNLCGLGDKLCALCARNDSKWLGLEERRFRVSLCHVWEVCACTRDDVLNVTSGRLLLLQTI